MKSSRWKFQWYKSSQITLVSIFYILTLVLKIVYGRSMANTSVVSKTTNVTSDTNYRVLLFMAQEEAKCLRDYGVRTREDNLQDTHTSADGEVFTNFKCVKNSSTFTQCQQCRSLTEIIPTANRCQELCGSDTLCSDKCFWIVSQIENLRVSRRSDDEEDEIDLEGMETLRIGAPEVFCEDMSLPQTSPEFHIVVLKWSLNLERNGIINETSHELPPIVFVLQRLDIGDEVSKWETRGKTLSLMQPMSSPYAQRTFRYRITAVGPEGPIGRTASGNISTHDGFVAVGPPKRIYIVKEIVDDNSLDVLVGWDPPDGIPKPCDYKVMQNTQDGEGKSVSHRFTATDLEDGLRVWLYNLKFKETYDVSITSRRANWDGFQSDLKSEIFTMPSCLEAHHNQFDKCVPSSPRNLSYEKVVITEKEGGEGIGQVKVKWEPPLHTSEENKLKSYSLVIFTPYNAKGLNKTATAHSSAYGIAAHSRSQKTINIPGDATEYIIQNVTLNRNYPIALLASSVKGDSPAAYLEVQTYIVQDEEVTSPITSWIYLSIPITLMIVGIFGCHFVKVLFKKRQVKLARNQYFQSMDEQDAMSADWSIVPLNDDSPTIKFLSEGPKEKWEISYDHLIMGEVIGQGAFGVVRRAKMARKKLQAIGNNKYSTAYHENAEVDENGMETVAVKMLKVSATRDDRDELIKEIVTMQNLGVHPQIVSLLGACTKGRSLCLVLEFCPGGDLLSFLRKVRAKYWPTLGLSEGKGSRSETSLEKQSLMRNCTSNTTESGCTSQDTYNSSNRKSYDNSPINYADMGVSSQFSTSPDKTSPANTVINHQYGRTNLDESYESEDDCRPINEKDILSYARQIAMGMEYLEKNRVVHRDLAGRNVLLLGDYKQVKISDFGLSRDIYTWNVYHQKSNGKLPIKWMAIESIFTHVFTSKSDVWSFGILLWELVTLGGTPYPGLGNTELFHLLKSGYRMERPDNCSEELYALMKKCWRTSPVSRPNFTELHRFLETMLEAAEPSLYLSLMADIPVDYFHLSSRSDLLHLKLDDDSPLREGSYNASTYKNYTGSSSSAFVNNNNNRKQLRSKNLIHQSNLMSSNPKNPVDIPLVDDSESIVAAISISLNATGLDSSTDSSPPSNKMEETISLRPHSARGSTNSNRSHSSFKRSHSIKSIQSIHLSQPLGGLKASNHCTGSTESLVSPDSGIPRSEIGGRELDDTWSENDEDDSTSPLTGKSPLLDAQETNTKKESYIPFKNLNSIEIIENKTYKIQN